MTDHITLPRSVVEQAIINIERMQVEANAPESFRKRAVELAETSVTALRAALSGAAQAEPVACQYGVGGYACCEGGPCKADEQNNATAPQPAQPVAVPQELLQAIDDYAETRHKCGDWTYNAKTSAAREKLRAMLNSAPTPPAATVPVLEPLAIEQINELPAAKEGWWPVGLADRIVRLIRQVEAAHAAKLAKRGGV